MLNPCYFYVNVGYPPGAFDYSLSGIKQRATLSSVFQKGGGFWLQIIKKIGHLSVA